MEFEPGFNVLVGQNNAGKTAILESFRFGEAGNRPHKSINNPLGGALVPHSTFSVDLIVEGSDIQNAFLKNGSVAYFPVPNNDGPTEYVEHIFSQPELTFQLKAIGTGGLAPRKWPSHSLFSSTPIQRAANVSPSPDHRSLVFHGHSDNNDSLPAFISSVYPHRIYVFKAERLNVGRTGAQQVEALSPNAANLAAVLMNLMGSNPDLYEKFNQNIRSIFPSIQHVSVVPSGTEYEIRMWTVDPRTHRSDLTVTLEESGTGIGQVLAILYVVMTVRDGVVVIDEPNSFLHPGAVKKLMQILRRHEHQYIISTHSSEVISSCDPHTVHFVRWDGKQTIVERLAGQNVRDLRRILDDLGIAFSDMFGADKIVWVEGITEQECFPKIIRARRGRMPLGVSIVAVRNTGDFETKKDRSAAIWEIYERLSGGNALLPVSLSFSFDLEGRSARDIEDLSRRSNGHIRFLPRRTYENFLLDASAISSVLNAARYGVTEKEISQWLDKNAEKYCSYEHPYAADQEDWKRSCNAAKLLRDLFSDVTDAKLEYRKTTHSVALTDWLLANAIERLEELVSYVETLVPTEEAIAAS
jgi:hypothetical protein